MNARLVVVLKWPNLSWHRASRTAKIQEEALEFKDAYIVYLNRSRSLAGMLMPRAA